MINGHPSLRPATRERVEDAIRQLGYRPNTVARALVTRRSATIGVIATNGGLWGPSTVHRTIQAAARESGYFVSSVNLPDVTREDLAAAVEHLRDHNVEGIVMIVANDEALDIARRQETGGVPVVVVEGDLSRAPWTVGVDQVAGARMATEHLLSLGHTTGDARGRAPALGRGARPARGLERARCTTPACGPSSRCWVTGPRRAATPQAGSLARLTATSTAVFVANDHMAIGVLRALAEAGRSVPERRQRRRLRRHPRVRLPDPAADHRAPGLHAPSGGWPSTPSRSRCGRRTRDAGGPGVSTRRGRLIKPELVLRASTAPAPGRKA